MCKDDKNTSTVTNGANDQYSSVSITRVSSNLVTEVLCQNKFSTPIPQVVDHIPTTLHDDFKGSIGKKGQPANG